MQCGSHIARMNLWAALSPGVTPEWCSSLDLDPIRFVVLRLVHSFAACALRLAEKCSQRIACACGSHIILLYLGSLISLMSRVFPLGVVINSKKRKAREQHLGRIFYRLFVFCAAAHAFTFEQGLPSRRGISSKKREAWKKQ